MGKLGKWIRNIMLGLVIVAFVIIFGQPGTGDGGAGGTVAEIRGESVSRDVFEFFREAAEQQLRGAEGIDDEQLGDILDQQATATLVQRYVLSQEAEDLGMPIPDEALRVDLQQNPAFQRDGRYDRELAEIRVARTGLGTREYMEQHRIDLLVRSFRRLLESGVRVSDAAVRDEIIRTQTSLQLNYAAAHASAFKDKVEISDEDAAALAATEPERIQALYQSRRSEFSREESIKAGHMLFTGDDAEARALQARARVEAGEKFTVVAKELSEDPATRELGGDLGSFPRGRMLTEFDEVAFGLEVNQLSGPVRTDRGVHLIRVYERQEALNRPLESVAVDLARELLIAERSAVAASEAAARVLKAIEEGKGLAQTGLAEGLEVLRTPPFQLQQQQVAGLEGVEGLIESAYVLTPEKPNGTRVLRRGDSFFVVSLFNRSEPSDESIEFAMNATREQMLNRARVMTTGLWFQERRRELEQSGEIKLFDLYPQN